MPRKTMNATKVKAFERQSRANTRNSVRTNKADNSLKRAQAKQMTAKSKATTQRIATANVLGTQMIQAAVQADENRTKRAALSTEKLKSWNSLIDGNPNGNVGQSGQTQNGSTTEIGSTDKRIRESINYG